MFRLRCSFAGLLTNGPWMACLMVICLITQESNAQPPQPLPAPPRPELTRESANSYLQQLQSDDYATRQRASQKLHDIGKDSLPDLVEACSHDDPETAYRAVSILEYLYVESLMLGDDSLTDQVEAALDSLAQSKQPLIADKIQYLYDQNSLIAEQALILKIKRLGGIVVFTEPVTRRVLFENRTIQRIGVDVVIGHDWTGGDAGLKTLNRLGALRRIYVIEGAPVSMAAVEEIQTHQPHLDIQRRSLARLGVQGLNGPDECRLSLINANSAAAKAGLKEGDVIVSFGNELIPNFDGLIRAIQKHQPGDTIPVKILRDGRDMRLNVVLEGWHPD